MGLEVQNMSVVWVARPKELVVRRREVVRVNALQVDVQKLWLPPREGGIVLHHEFLTLWLGMGKCHRIQITESNLPRQV